MNQEDREAAAQRLAQALLDFLSCTVPLPKEPEREYSVEELAERFGLARSTMLVHIRGGEFGENVIRHGHMVRITETGVQYYIENHLGPGYVHKRAKQKRVLPKPGQVTGRI